MVCHYWWALFGGRHIWQENGSVKTSTLKSFCDHNSIFLCDTFSCSFLLFDIEAWSCNISVLRQVLDIKFRITSRDFRFLCFRASRSADLSQRILESICDGLAASQSPDSKHSFHRNSLQLDFIQWCGIVISSNGSQMQRHEDFYFSPRVSIIFHRIEVADDA